MFSQERAYQLKNKINIFKERISYEAWKDKLLRSSIDFAFNSLIIGLTAFLWISGDWWLRGFSITLFFILLKSYTKEFKELFGG